MPRAIIDGDSVRIMGVRNFDYRWRATGKSPRALRPAGALQPPALLARMPRSAIPG